MGVRNNDVRQSNREKKRRQRAKNPERFYLMHKRWVTENRERARVNARRGYWKNREKNLESLRARSKARRDLLWSLKDKPCLDCGVKYHPAVMEFDHVRGEKLFQIGPCRTLRLDRLLAEIAKCDLVCANCHRMRTWRRQEAQEPGGLSIGRGYEDRQGRLF